MTMAPEAPALFDVRDDGGFDLHVEPQGVIVPENPVLNGVVESGLYVDIADRRQHLTHTYVALSQLALASRGEAATNQPAAVRRITAAKGDEAQGYLAKVATRTRGRLLEARGAYWASVDATMPESEVDPRTPGWYNFRTTYSGPQGAEARDAYRAEVEKYLRNFGYDVPEVS